MSYACVAYIFTLLASLARPAKARAKGNMSASKPTLRLPARKAKPLPLNPLRLCKRGQYEQLFRGLRMKRNPYKDHVHVRTQCLMYAAAQGNFEAVCELVEVFKFDPRCIYNGLSPLQCAIAYGHMEIVKYLVIENGCGPECETESDHCTKPRCAGLYMHGSLVFLCNLTDHNKSVSKYRKPIEISHIHVEILKFLFDCGWTYKQERHMKGQLFYILKFVMDFGNVHDFGYLISHNHVSMDKIKREGLVENIITDGLTSAEILKYLIREGALCITVKMFQRVARKVSDAVCLCLLEHCTEDVYSTALGKTWVQRVGYEQPRDKVLLDSACEHKLPVLSKALAERNLNSQDSAGRTPLHIACEHDYLELVSFLVSQQCDQSIADADGYLALHVACMHSSLEVVKLLRFDNKRKTDKFGNTVVHMACKGRRENVIKYVVKEKGYAVSDLNTNHKLPLHIVTSHTSSTKNLIAMVSDNVDVNVVDNRGRTPVFNACDSDDLSIVEYLACQRQCDLAVRNKAGLLPLNCLVRKRGDEVVPTVIKVLNCNDFNVDEEDREQNTLLHVACMERYIDLVRYLVMEKKCSVNKVNKDGNLPLHIACYSQSLEMAELVSCDVDKGNLVLRNKDGHTPLHIVCGQFKSKPIAQHLVSIGCRPVDNPGLFTDLNIRLACVNKSDASFLFAIATKDNISSSALKKACLSGNVLAVRHLTQVLKYSGEYETLLHIACAHSLEMVECVIRDTEVNVADCDGNTPLHIACSNGKSSIVELLVKKFNCDQSVLNTEKEYALHLSCKCSLETVKLLTITAEHLLQISFSGLTPLHIACEYMKFDIVQYMLEVMEKFEVDVNSVVDCGTVHPLKLACETGSVEMVKCLIQNGINMHDKLPDGNTILHIACSVGSLEMVKYLISRDYDTLITNSSNEYPLHIACTKSLELVKITSSECGAAELEAKTVDDLTPLHLAASSGLLDVIRYLVESLHCNLLTTGRYGKNALAYACDFASRLREPTAFLNVKYFVNHMEQVLLKGTLYSYEEHSKSLVQTVINQHNFDLFKAFFCSEMFINCQDEDANTPLILLCKKARNFRKQKNTRDLIKLLSREVKYLIKGRNCDQHIQNSNQELALHLACESGHFEIVKRLESNCDIKNRDGDTALHIVCRRNSLQILKSFVDKSNDEDGCDSQAFNILNNKSQSPLHLAVITDSEEMVKLLLSEVKNISCLYKDSKGLAPVHYASSVSVLKVLTDHNIENRDLLDSSGNSPLHTFIKSKCYPLAEFLLSIDAVVDVQNSDGDTPMHLACDVEPLTLPPSNSRRKPIPMNFDLPTVKKLLSRVSSLSVQNNNGDTPLHIACRSKDVRLVNLLLEAQHEVDLTIQNNSGDTPFHIACATACFPVVDALMSLGSSVDAVTFKNSHGDTPFHITLGLFEESRNIKGRKFKAKSCLEFFAANCLDFNIQNNDDETVLHLSCKVVNSYSIHIVEFLVKSGADLAKVDVRKQLPLHVAASRFLELVKLCCSLPLVDQQDENGNTALHIACMHSKLETAKFLLNEMKCNPIIRNKMGQTPLHCASKRSRSTVNCDLIVLLAQFVEESLDFQDINGDTPIHILCSNSNLEAITEVSIYECNLRLQNNSGETPLHIVCSNPKSPLELVKCVANCDPELKLKDSPCDTALHLACRNCSSEVVQYLLENGHQCATQIPNKDGDLPIHILCKRDSLSSIQVMLGFFNNFNQHNVCGDTPLHIAVKNTISYETISYLIEEAKCDVTIQNKEGDLPLHIACCNTSRFEEKLQKLLANSETVNVPNSKRNSALHEYCIGLKSFKYKHSDERVIDTLNFLLKLGAKLSQANADGKYPIHLACRYASRSAVKLFEPRGLTEKSTDGNTVLHEACANNTNHAPAIVDHLLNYRPPLNYSTINCEGDTALHIACRNNELRHLVKKIFKEFLQFCGVLLNVPNKDGNTVLFELFHYEYPQDLILYVMKSTNVKLQVVNIKKETILHLACRNNFKSIVSFLLRRRLSDIKDFINLPNTDEQTPIVLTTDREIVQLLIDNKANPDPLYKMYDTFFRDYSLRSPPEMPVSILVVGYSGVGKTTLVSSLKKEKGSARSETLLPTAGIVPNNFKGEKYGQVIMYDFAGQPEYYASHNAIIHAIVKKLAPIVLLVVDLTYPIDHAVRAINYWSSFISNRLQSCTDRAHLYVICSHSDVVKKKGENVQTKAKALRNSVEATLMEVKLFDFKDMLSMDCRNPQSRELNKLRKYFARSTKQLRKKAVINFESHCLSVYMKQLFSDKKVVPFDDLLDEVVHAARKSQDAPKLLPKDPNQLKKICKDLNDTGVILFLESSHCSSLVLDKDALLREVSGKLFAPKSFKEHVDVYSSPTGVVNFSRLQEIFPHYDPNMLFGFLCQMEYCQEIIDENVKKILRMGKVKSLDKHYFFPHAVSVERPPEVWEHSDGYQFGWIMECSTSHHFNPNFVQILLLRLIFSQTECIKLDIISFQSRSTIWKSGLTWRNGKCISTLVDVIDHSKVVVLVHCKDTVKDKVNSLQHRSSLLKTIRCARNEVCPGVKVSEFLIDPQSICYPLKSTCMVSFEEITKRVSWREDCAYSSDGKPIEIDALLFCDPYTKLCVGLSSILYNVKFSRTKPNRKVLLALSGHLNDCFGIFVQLIDPAQVYLKELSPDANKLLELFNLLLNNETNTFQTLRNELENITVFDVESKLPGTCFKIV